MPEAKRTFTLSRINKNVDSRLMKKGEYRDALNFRVSKSEGQDAGAGENSLSNKKLTNFAFGANPVTLGMYGDESEDKIYWFVTSDTTNYVIEWDNINEVSQIVLEDSRVGDDNVLNFDPNYLITGVNVLVDSDNNNRFLLWTDGLNAPRQINIERAKSYGANNFNEQQISVIKTPPIDAPEITMVNSATQKENHLKDKFFQFSYRYKYLDGEYSSISPFSEVAFIPEVFSYDFNKSSNESMVNLFNAVDIQINTGSNLVVSIDVLAKRPDSNVVEVIETFNKDFKGWGNNEDVNFVFLNNKKYKNLSKEQLTRLYDNVPLKAFSQDILGNRIFYGAYTENYNIEDCDGNTINPNYILSFDTSEIVNNSPKRTMKTNRDYEAVIVYSDKYGRLTTGLKSENNTVHIPIGNSITSNKLKLEIASKAPCFAEYYRVFIKENKQQYETIIPTLFFFETNFVYFFIQPSDVPKVSENDFLIVKADTEGISDEVVKLKVLEVERKEKDFISDNDGGQPSGFYIKTSVVNEDVRFDLNSYSFYEQPAYDISENSYRINETTPDYIKVLFKGDTLDDLTATSTFIDDGDLRYEVEIVNTGVVDTFRWRTQQVDGTFSDWDDNDAGGGNGYDITGAPQALGTDLEITFNAVTGHGTSDRWLVKKNEDITLDEDNRSYGIFLFPDNVTIGSIITLKYYSKKENSPSIEEFNRTFISNGNYENLEEWYYGDEIYNELAQEANYNFADTKIYFRNANATVDEILGRSWVSLDINENGDNYVMFIESLATSRNSSRKVYSDVYIEVRSLEQLPIFEKELEGAFDREIYHEVGRTYRIDQDRNHLGFDLSTDTSQTSSNSAIIELPINNAYAWGNGFESYKIRDTFNATPLFINTRPTSVIDDYRENFKIASITYSQPYEQTTNFNGLNEFNLSLINYKDLDDKYGQIRLLYGRDNDLIVFQEDKVIKVLFNKSVIFNADGTGNVSQSVNVLGQEIPYKAEYGISTNPESMAFYGNNIYFTDAKRGAVLRLGAQGITEIVGGMSDWFRDNFIQNQNSIKLGEYDPYHDQYTLALGEEPEKDRLQVKCGSTIYKVFQTQTFTYTFVLNGLDGDVELPYNITQGSVSITASFNGSNYQVPVATGSGTLSFTRDTLDENEVTVTIVPISSPAEYTITNTCPVGTNIRVIRVIVNDAEDSGATMTSRYKWGSSAYFSELPVFDSGGVTLFDDATGIQGVGRFPLEGQTIRMESFRDTINSGIFDTDANNKLSYLVSNTVYTDSDIATILSSATDLGITTVNKGGIPQTDYGEFTLTRPLGTEILYLIWNYQTTP